jgi:hypothetical protein
MNRQNSKAAIASLATAYIFAFCCLFVANVPGVKAEDARPTIWVKNSDRAAILHKIETQPWAQSLYQQSA